MKDLIIICAGGLGRETFHLARRCQVNGAQFNIKGFIDDTMPDMSIYPIKYPPVLSTIEDYIPMPNDVFVCSIGNVHAKKRIVEMIEAKGGKFISLIDPDAYIECSAKIENGALIFHHAFVGSEVSVGKYAFIQSFAALGHDVVTGDFFRIDPKASCAGRAQIGDCVTIHTLAFVNERVKVEDNAVIGALSMVLRTVKAGETVFGIPAKKI